MALQRARKNWQANRKKDLVSKLLCSVSGEVTTKICDIKRADKGKIATAISCAKLKFRASALRQSESRR